MDECDANPKSRASSLRCDRCGRTSHSAGACYASTHAKGYALRSESEQFVSSHGRKGVVDNHSDSAGVYVLLLEGGNIYVGKANIVEERIRQHQLHNTSSGSAWTRKHRVIKRIPCLTPPMDDLECWERVETLEQMVQRGIEKVRGWHYVQVKLDKKIHEEIRMQLVNRYELCKSCGKKGHFVSQCPRRRYAK
jgi:hypothetical protein